MNIMLLLITLVWYRRQAEWCFCSLASNVRWREWTNILRFFLDIDRAVGSPSSHRFFDVLLHVFGDLGFEKWRLEEGPHKAMDFLLKAAIDEQDGGFTHQLSQGFRVGWHEGLGIALEDELVNFCICRDDGWASEYVWLEHVSVPKHHSFINQNKHSSLATERLVCL